MMNDPGVRQIRGAEKNQFDFLYHCRKAYLKINRSSQKKVFVSIFDKFTTVSL